jgi:hypothetical protein
MRDFLGDSGQRQNFPASLIDGDGGTSHTIVTTIG